MLDTIYTDGSCLNNPGGPGGYAAVIFRDGEKIQEISVGEAVTTSSRMEIRAAIVGLQAVREPSIIEGSLLLTADGKPGDAFQQRPQHVHEGQNGSATAPVKILAVYLADKGQPLTTAVPK